MNKELEEAIKICNDFIEENKSRKIILYKAIETVLKALENSILKEVIEIKIEELKQNVEDFENIDNTGRFKKTKCIDYYKLEALKELLEENKNETR